jgi:hypothetical protein
MKNRVFLIAAFCLLVSLPAGAGATGEKAAAPQAPVKQREPAPPPSLILNGGVDVMLALDRKIGGYVDAAVVFGHVGISLNGDVISVNLAQEANATAIGAMGFLSCRYYGRMTSLVGNYLMIYFLGGGAGYGVMGYESESGDMDGMSYAGLSPAIPFDGEIGFQMVFANQMLVQSLVRAGGALLIGNEVNGMYPFVSVSLSVGVLLE